MLNKFLDNVVVIVAGKKAEGLADLLNNKDYVNEFTIAKKMDITINQVRNLLYSVSSHGLVSSIRKRDKKKGWYTYFWKLEVIECLEFLKSILIEKDNILNKEIEEKKDKTFYFCKRCKREFDEEEALLRNFLCDECGQLMGLKNNSKFLRQSKKSLTQLRNELNILQKEIDAQRAIAEEKQKRKMKRENLKKKKGGRKPSKKKTQRKPVKKKAAKRKKSIGKTKPGATKKSSVKKKKISEKKVFVKKKRKSKKKISKKRKTSSKKLKKKSKRK